MTIDKFREDEIRADPDPAYIAATGPEHRIRRTLKHGDTFLVIDAYGDVGAASGTSDGLYHCDTRFLSRLELRINGLQPLLLGSSMREDNAVFIADLTNPDMFSRGRVLMLEKDTVHVNRANFLWRDAFFQRISLRNHGAKRVELSMAITFAGDFADLFEVRGMRRDRRGTSSNSLNPPHEVVMSYLGLDDVVRVTSVYFDPSPTRLSEREATYLITLTAHETMSICVATRCNPSVPKPAPFVRSLLHAHRELRHAAQGAAVVETSNPVFDSILRRSMADLAMLKTETPQGPFPCAGTPWYATTFGRDGLVTALQMLWVDPRIAKGVLFRLAALQAKTVNPASDAEPGKILHEMRSGEMAALGEVPFALY
ncbi:MAG: amylo-alpha-1,6-glucosidase, partial [Bradyrhizobiaceae bacterium]|nr:amylo-alpha-1,6-glucosidase [Bradyrhizobiaceae bacterium]